MDTPRIVIADDSVLLRAGAVRLLEEAGFDVVAQAGDADECVRQARAHRPDVAIVDIRMPPAHADDGLRAAVAIRAERAGAGVLVLSHHVEASYATELLEHGADGVGYLLKDRIADVDRFVDAVWRVARGGTVLDPEVVAHMVGRRARAGVLHELTGREQDVLMHMAQGRSNRGIAELLIVSERAVERHVTSIFDKLRLPRRERDHRRVLAVLAYLRA